MMNHSTKLIYKIIVGIFLIFLLMPLIVIIVWSITKNWPWPEIIPNNFGLRGWNHFLNSSSNSISTLFFSLFLSSVVTVCTLIITIPAANGLALYRFKGKRLIELLIFAPVIVPAVAVAMGIHIQFIRIGLANTFWGVVLIQLIPCIPYSIRILKSVFEMIGGEMELQAKVLGANSFQVVYHIILPMILPGIISAGGMVFIVSLSQYFLTLLIGGGRIITFSMLMFPYVQSGDRMMGSVYSVVFIFTTLIFLVLIEGLTGKFYRDKLKEYYYV